VYQTNVFVGQFDSFKKCLRELQALPDVGSSYANVELVSLHSVSKGMIGECGQRGGYFELVGFDPEVEAQIFKFISIMLCPPVLGQCMIDCMVRPPREGEPSFPLYKQEYDAIYDGLKARATALYEAFKEMEGVECQVPQVSDPAEPRDGFNVVQGAMYLFPTITLPEKAIAAARAEKREPDEFYCLKLLEATGVCVVPGSGFGQKEGTLHFRTTFLAPGTQWVSRIAAFHKKFMDEYR
jgi:alanine transaminase